MTLTALDIRRWRPPARLAAFASGVAVLVAVFFGAARPWYLGWGATEAEKGMRLPGDDIVQRATSQETRAIAIRAPAEAVWAWVAQIGQDRAGFYSYKVLEDLAGCEMPDVQELNPALQRWQVGDKLWMYPPQKLHGMGHAVLQVLQPGRALGFATRQIGTPGDAPYDGSWSFIVRPVDRGSSRLLFRGRGTGPNNVFATAFTVFGFEPIHFAMERRTLETIKLLAEGGRPRPAMNNLQVLLWTVTFACFVASAALLLAGRRPARRLGTMLAAGLLFQLLTLVQPSPLLGLPIVIGLVAAVWLGAGRV